MEEDDTYFDYSEVLPPMDIIIQMDGFERSTYREQEKAERKFCHSLTEEVLVPLRKQIHLDSNIDLVVTITNVSGEKCRRKISFLLNTADIEFFKDDTLYQVITRREKVSGNLYEMQYDASKVRMHYVHRDAYEEYNRDMKKRRKKSESALDPRRKKKIMRKKERPTIPQLNQLIAQSVLRFRDAINEFIEKYFKDERPRPKIVGIFNRSDE